jgi:hypothetical protein
MSELPTSVKTRFRAGHALTVLLVFLVMNLPTRENRDINTYGGEDFGHRVYESTEQPREEEAHGETDEPMEFFLFQREIRTRDGESGPGYRPGYRSRELMQSRAFARARGSVARAMADGVLSWDERGPGNVPGRTRALFNIPATINNTWLAGAATGGIWKTTDGGSTWLEKNDNLTALPISSFAATQTASVIYAGTGELVSSAFSAMGDGIFKSVDFGETWTPIASTQNNADFAVVTRLIVNPDNANIILATTAPPSTDRTATTSAVMRSTNGGASWTKVREVTGTFDQIVFTPGNFQVQYASQNGVGVWKSTNAGLTWSLSNTGMLVDGRVELAVSPADPLRVYASAEGGLSGVESDLYVSIDAGATWSLVDVTFNGSVVDFLGTDPDEPDSQGFYDNTILCDPFNANIVYFGGINLFRTTLLATTSTSTYYDIDQSASASLVSLINFSGNAAQGQLDLGPQADGTTVELRFGPSRTQKAHRFLVPEGSTSGVPDMNYTYQDYVDVPFEVWDITNNRQLMVSFRDQGRDGTFNLITAETAALPAENQSREYIYVHDKAYSASAPDPAVTDNGGHMSLLMYNIWPVLADGASWPSAVNRTMTILASAVDKRDATTITVADGYGNFDSKNIMSQTDLEAGVHVDHHTMIPIVIDANAKTYKVLLGNDGGVFVSNVGITPGTTNGSWQFKGFGYNTSQFYGADKQPGADRFIGGLQDNGTRISPTSGSASASTAYSYALGGDGFEVIWNNLDANRILGCLYFGQIYRTGNAGNTWGSATNGLSEDGFPFVTKLANSLDFPNRVFTVARQGVFVSNDFGGSWSLTAIPNNFAFNTASTLDVEVSRANANIVWAGGGMSNTAGQVRRIFVSTNGGQSFTATINYNVVAMGSITKLASHPTEPSTAYAIFSFARGPKILRTKNLGQAWTDISGFNSGTASTNGFPDVAVFCLYVRPDNPSILWAGTEIGIVESVDDGATWSLLEEFPKVSVWDMKAQDNQVVIATHGRGIWTATIDQSQGDFRNLPEIIASGTSPAKELMLRIQSLESFDSVGVYTDGGRVTTLRSVIPGQYDVALTGITPGDHGVNLIAYFDNALYQTETYNVTHLNILGVKDQYATYFATTNDLTLTNISPQGFSDLPPAARRSLMTSHPYASNSHHSVLIRTPIRVSSTFPKVFYADVAIVEPGKDSVTIEATLNGLDWLPVSGAYSASRDVAWQEAFSNNLPGLNTMLVHSEVEVGQPFAAGDTLLFRLSMTSGPSTPAWGWALDFVSIQVQPVAVENVRSSRLTAYPNPARDVVNLQYSLSKDGYVKVTFVDPFGRILNEQHLGERKAGDHEDTLPVGTLVAGTYLVRLSGSGQDQMTRLLIVR